MLTQHAELHARPQRHIPGQSLVPGFAREVGVVIFGAGFEADPGRGEIGYELLQRNWVSYEETAVQSTRFCGCRWKSLSGRRAVDTPTVEPDRALKIGYEL
ncbi:hypothetical protein EVAR_55441_1 [Eumeta japonica]|uniref:Uncharacterized protein n=1 Tax=Eumeta variegata TaxID=151549 RepID=A0A4C1Y5K4_EUMVA|nr:hypothetical protein EVAR_55441_1 [Eumeta japonica]